MPDYQLAPDRLRKLWQAWEAMPYPTEQHPPGSLDDIERVGVDLALLDGDLGWVFDKFFDKGELDRSEPSLSNMLADLRRAIPNMTGHGRVYFELALVLLEHIGAGISANPPPE